MFSSLCVQPFQYLLDISCFNHFIQNHWTNFKSNVTKLLLCMIPVIVQVNLSNPNLHGTNFCVWNKQLFRLFEQRFPTFCRGHYRMVVGFTTTYAISAYYY